MIESTKDRIEMMEDLAWMRKYPSGRIGEAGAMQYEHSMKLATGASVRHIREKLKLYLDKYIGKNWRSKLPNIDIRHGNNFTKNKRGTKRTYQLPYWGTMKDVFNTKI